MKHAILRTLAVALLGSGSLFAAGDGWVQDFAAAKATAAKDKKDLLMDFTGSDWCGWCIKLDKEVFSQDAFKNVVPNDFVLVQLDFPQDEAKVTPEVKAQNEKLQKEYAVEGYPTIILADASGRPYAKTGYEEGGPEKYAAHLATLRDARVGRDEAFAKAAKAEGLEKAKFLAEGLAKIDQELHNQFYPDEVKTIIEADKEDTLGFGKKAKSAEMAAEFAKKIEDLRPQIMELLEKKDFAAAGKTVDDLIAKENYQGEMKQRAMAVKISFFGMSGDHQGAMKLVDEIIAIDEKSETAGDLKELKPRIEQAMAGAKNKEGENAADEAPEETPTPAPAVPPAGE